MREGERRRDAGEKKEVEEEEKAFSPYRHAKSLTHIFILSSYSYGEINR